MDKTLKALEEKHAELKQHLRIDRNNLETELEKQADLFYEICEEHTRAISRRDELEVTSKEQYALCADAVRRNAEDSGEKITEAYVKEQVAMDKDYLDATATYLEAKKLSDLFAGLRDAFDQRGKMLRELAQLYLGGYYQVVRVESGGSVMREAMAGAAREAMAKSRAAVGSGVKPEPPQGRSMKEGEVPKKKFGKRN